MTHPALAQRVAQQDQEFAKEPAEGGLVEASWRSRRRDDQVVQFGQRMGEDYGHLAAWYIRTARV